MMRIKEERKEKRVNETKGDILLYKSREEKARPNTMRGVRGIYNQRKEKKTRTKHILQENKGGVVGKNLSKFLGNSRPKGVAER